MKEITQHGKPVSVNLERANDGYQADAILVTFEDGWTAYLSQQEDAEIGAVHVDWFDGDGEYHFLGETDEAATT